MVGRLEPGVTTAEAKASLDVLYRQLNEEELRTTFTDATESFRTRFRAKAMLLHPAARDQRAIARKPIAMSL